MKTLTPKKTAIQNTSSKSHTVIKSRDLNEAYFPNFSLNEYRLYSLVLSKVVKFDKTDKKNFIKSFFETHIVTPKEFSEIFKVSINHCYKIVKNCGYALNKKEITIKKSTGIQKIHICSSVEYNTEKHYLEIRLSHEIIPHIDVTERYVKTRLYEIALFKSVYSIRLYELITSFRSLGKCKLSIEKLRFILGVEQKIQYKEIKRSILTPAINEVNKVCNFDIKHEEAKEGKKVAIINFTCKKSKKKELDDEYKNSNKALSITHEEDIKTRLAKIGVQMTVHIRTDILHYTSDRILEEAYRILEEQIKKGNVRSRTAYFIQLVKKLKRTGFI